MVVGFGAYQAHFAALMDEATALDLLLINPADPTTNAGDPHLVALALLLDRSESSALRSQAGDDAKCIVVTEEKRRNPGARLARIPDVCDHYGLTCVTWLELLIREGFRA